MDPAGGFAFTEDVGNGRQVNEMYSATILLDAPMMCVSKNVSFNLLSRTNPLENRHFIFQAHVAAVNARVVVHQNQSGLVRMRIECLSEPLQLFRSHQAG